LNQGKYDEAIKIFDEVIRIDPEYSLAWNNKGYALSKQGKYDEAIKAYDEAIRLDPNNVHAWNNKGEALKALGRTSDANAAKAEADAAKAKAGAIKVEADTWMRKGTDLMNQGHYEEAINAFNKTAAIQSNTDPGSVSLTLEYEAMCFESWGKYDEAVKTYDKVIELKPSDLAGAWVGKSKALQHLGRYDEAAKAREKAIEIAPITSRDFGNATVPVHIKMGPYDLSYNDYEPPIKWTTDSYPLYTISSGWENNELKTTRTPSGMVYHAISGDSNYTSLATEIWITHPNIYAPASVIGEHLVKEGYPESIWNVKTHSDVDRHPAKEEISCKEGTLTCMDLVAWQIDNETACEVKVGGNSSTILRSIHIEK
jgi:tetratricopeptide (TPR) repeat protein